MTEATPQSPVELTAEEMKFIWFIPQAPGGKVVPPHVLESLTRKGIATFVEAAGAHWLTQFGDQARRGAVPIVRKG